MKKILLFLLVMCIAATVPMQVAASSTGIVENPPISMDKSSPVIDGNITDYEGWSSAAEMNYDTLGFFWHVNPLTMNGTVKFAWDEEYYYYCADIIDGFETVHEITGDVIEAGTNSFIYSTGEDDIDRKTDGTAFGYNGDVFGMLIDPLGLFIENGYVGGDDNTPWYLVSLFEGDAAKMYREKVNARDITDDVKVAGCKTADGWRFEAAIPWDMIIEDVENISYGDCVIDKAELFANGANIRAAAMYHDRFYDTEAEEVATWGCFVTVPDTMLDGLPGYLGTGTNVLSLGLSLNIQGGAENKDTEDITADDTSESSDSTDTTVPVTDDTTTDNGGKDTVDNGSDDTTTKAPETTIVDVTDDKGNAVTDDKGNKVTEKVTVKEEETETAIVEVTDDKGNVVTDSKGNKVTEKVTVKKPVSTTKTGASTTKKPATGTAMGGDAAQTFDIGIAIALGALAASGIGVSAAKKKR